ncbi:hypothetical protein ACFBZI_07705 [Moraxella sp. ZJ142]|uniref:hypothetical protein n=1 Tax=Moraxella marmotae TaxID=3344520 RepID=UPI0035D4373A
MIIEGLQAPFLTSWLGFWLFSMMGGLASGFVKIDDIDNRLRHPFIAKPLIGTISGMAIAVYLNQNAEPPPPTLLFWAFIASLLSTPIVTGLLVFISDQRRQDQIYSKAKDKFLPWSKEDKQ